MAPLRGTLRGMSAGLPSTVLGAESVASRRGADTRILIADTFDAPALEGLQALGCQVQFDPDLSADTLAAAMTAHDPDILIVRGTRVLTAVFEASKSLSLIVRAGAGYDTIDVAAASTRGIFVANCPGKNSIAVAELAWSLILACD